MTRVRILSVDLGHFDKQFIKNKRKKGPARKDFGAFSSRYSYIFNVKPKDTGLLFPKSGHFFRF